MRLALPTALLAAILHGPLWSSVLEAQVVAASTPMSERRAVSLALERNLTLAAARVDAQLADVAVAKARAAWAPTFLSTVSNTRAVAPASTLLAGNLAQVTDAAQASQVGVTQRLPIGLQYRVSWDASNRTTNNLFARFNPQLTSSASVEAVQPLLRGLGIDADRAETSVAIVNQRRAAAALEAAVATTARAATRAYWQWVFAVDTLTIERDSRRLAVELLEQNRERVSTGAMAAVDLVEADAEVARRDEAILVAAKNVQNAEDVLRKVTLAVDGERAPALLRLPEEDAPPGPLPDVLDLDSRVDVRTARAALDGQRVTVRLLRDEARPDVSVRVSYTAQSLSGTELLRTGGFPGTIVASASRGFGSALADLAAARYPTWTAQLSMSYPLGANRAAVAVAEATLVARRQQAALDDVLLAARTDIRIARREVEVGLQRLVTTRTAVDLATRRLDGEQRKFTAGLSTSFFVFQAQRDLAVARQTLLRATLDYRLAHADLEAVTIVPLGLDQGLVR